MNKYKMTVFDFDGTLVDSAPGVAASLDFALNKLGLTTPPGFDIRPCLGPPLSWSFRTQLNVPPERVAEAIEAYREHYSRSGAFDAALYPGIKELLEDLNKAGITVGLATAKYSAMAEMMLEHFGLRPLIDRAAMAGADQVKTDKKEMLESLMKQCGRSREETVMIGDTKYDAEGAAKAEVDFIGVLYGYGLSREMEEAGGSEFVPTVEALRQALL